MPHPDSTPRRVSPLTLLALAAAAAEADRGEPKALEKWARHTRSCTKTPRTVEGVTFGEKLEPAPCTCGLDDALRTTPEAGAATLQEAARQMCDVVAWAERVGGMGLDRTLEHALVEAIFGAYATRWGDVPSAAVLERPWQLIWQGA